jgi:hypothetical protein
MSFRRQLLALLTAVAIPIIAVGAILGTSAVAHASTTGASVSSHAVSVATSPLSADRCPECTEEIENVLCVDLATGDVYICEYTPGGEWAWGAYGTIPRGTCPTVSSARINASVARIGSNTSICVD